MHAAQVLTGATMAAWLLAGFLPRYGRRLRAFVVGLYLAGVAAFALYLVAA